MPAEYYPLCESRDEIVHQPETVVPCSHRPASTSWFLSGYHLASTCLSASAEASVQLQMRCCCAHGRYEGCCRCRFDIWVALGSSLVSLLNAGTGPWSLLGFLHFCFLSSRPGSARMHSAYGKTWRPSDSRRMIWKGRACVGCLAGTRARAAYREPLSCVGKWVDCLLSAASSRRERFVIWARSERIEENGAIQASEGCGLLRSRGRQQHCSWTRSNSRTAIPWLLASPICHRQGRLRVPVSLVAQTQALLTRDNGTLLISPTGLTPGCVTFVGDKQVDKIRVGCEWISLRI
jgi:hypothetical protein